MNVDPCWAADPRRAASSEVGVRENIDIEERSDGVIDDDGNSAGGSHLVDVAGTKR
jgi:hypothetical protein